MLTFSELTSVFSSIDFGSILGWTASAAILPVIGSTMMPDTSEQDEPEFDEQGLRSQIAEMEKLRTRTIEQQEELAELYVKIAIGLYTFDEDCELQEIFDFFAKAEAVLRQTLAQGEDDETRRKLGTVDLHRAVTYNDCDGMDEAVQCYTSAIETLTPLENKGDGEAKYDIAGMKLNRGMIFHELGEFEKANKDYDEAFLAFRAVEKISDLDTRFYMAKVSVAQGSLFRDMDEPLEKIVDAYNRAMRLYVELIDVGQLEHERELANVLMDRCTAMYEAYMNKEFESESERTEKFDAVLLDIDRAIEILQKNAVDGNSIARIDLFNAHTSRGAMLLDLEKFDDALSIFDQVIKDFAEFESETDPVLVNQFGAAYENRGFALMNRNRFEEALASFNRAITCRERIQSPSFELDDDERENFVPGLATLYANRANAYAALKKMDEAKADCRLGIQLLQPLKSKDGEELDEIDEIETMLKALLEILG